MSESTEEAKVSSPIDTALRAVRDQKTAMKILAPTQDGMAAVANLTLAECILIVGKEMNKKLDTIESVLSWIAFQKGVS